MVGDSREVIPDWPSLPEHLWLAIFSKCSPRDLLNIRDVCLQWRRIANDFTLTSSLCLKYDKWLTESNHLEDLISFAANNLITIDINGRKPNPRHSYISSLMVRMAKDSHWLMITNRVMSILKNKCKRLRRLALSHIRADITYESLPFELSHLWLTHYHNDYQKLFGSQLTAYDKYKTIVYLNISSDQEFESQLCRSLNHFISLKCLYMEDLFRVNDGGIADFSPTMISNLVVIDLEGTDISDQSFQYILRNCSSLEALYLGATNCVGNLDFEESAAKRLKELCLLNTRIGLSSLRNILRSHRSLESVNCDENLRQAINSSVVFTKGPTKVKTTCRHYNRDKRFDGTIK